MAVLLALVAATLSLPLTGAEGWEVLRYRNIPPHTVGFGPDGMRIEVDASAAPVIRPLDRPRRVRRLEARGRIEGRLQTTAAEQGRTGHDDYTLRVGLVEVGTTRPGWFGRQFAPAWVKRLFALAPSDLGIAGIRFYNLGLAASQIGDARQHPASDLIRERVVAVPAPDGTFTLTVDLDTPVKTTAVWISSDGDDTRSRFVVTLERLALVTDDATSSPAAADRAPTAPLARR